MLSLRANHNDTIHKREVAAMKQIVPEVYVKNCKDAIRFYAEAFGGTVKNLRMSDELELFRGLHGKVIHAELHVNRHCVFYLIDALDRRRERTGNVALMLHMDTLGEARRAYDALRTGGDVLMELQRTRGGAYHAIVTDRFGAAWSILYAGR
jgi:PhnB protein